MVPEANLSIIQGVTEVDWDQSVYFGEGPGQYSGSIIETQQQNEGISTGVTVGTTSSIAVPPNQRKVVQQYFSNESSE